MAGLAATAKEVRQMKTTLMKIMVTLLATVALTAPVAAEPLDQLSLDRWKQLREVERYQLNIAEKYYREKNFKVGLSEYEKFLTLYEQSEGASYA